MILGTINPTLLAQAKGHERDVGAGSKPAPTLCLDYKQHRTGYHEPAYNADNFHE